jgi:hypothetical protein
MESGEKWSIIIIIIIFFFLRKMDCGGKWYLVFGGK